jgi:hydrophobic/amphiphilic exporter-1 (mainly G- bacteria), HAE1 family
MADCLDHRPLAFAISEGWKQRAPMGQAVIGGRITSSLPTLVALVVVPVIYCYLDDLSQWLQRKLRSKPHLVATVAEPVGDK